MGKELEGRAFRIGHMGDINEPMTLGAHASVETALRQAGVRHDAGAVDAAIDAMATENVTNDDKLLIAEGVR